MPGVDARPLLWGCVGLIIVLGGLTIAADLADLVTNDADFSIGWFAAGLGLISALTMGLVPLAMRLAGRGSEPLVAVLIGVGVALLGAVMGLVAFSAAGAAVLYLIGAAGSIACLAIVGWLAHSDAPAAD